MGLITTYAKFMAYRNVMKAHGAFSRHVVNRRKKGMRVAKFGSRHAYRRDKKTWGGKGMSFG